MVKSDELSFNARRLWIEFFSYNISLMVNPLLKYQSAYVHDHITDGVELITTNYTWAL